jgi:hypothetical protein
MEDCKGVVNINTAMLDELKLLNLDEKTALAVINERAKVRGSFKSPKDIKKVVGKACWHIIKDKVVIKGETTLKPAANKGEASKTEPAPAAGPAAPIAPAKPAPC